MSSHIDDFKEFIKANSATDAFRRYILHSDCQMIESSQSYALKSKICDKLNVGFDNVIVVGSCKLGFSIKPTRDCSIWDESDIDVAIVSPVLFENVWRTALEYKYSNADWQSKKNFLNIYHRDGYVQINSQEGKILLFRLIGLSF
jgi:hypothetical protein